MKIFADITQGSDEWFALKSGIPSASSADKILTPAGKLSARSAGYLDDLLAERAGLGGPKMKPTEWMQRGLDLEPAARKAFVFESGINAYQVGFVTNDEGTAGCSPDALCGYESTRMDVAVPAGLEIKCPQAGTHFGYLRAGVLPKAYAPQVHMSMAISGIPLWYFMSYFPGLDPLIVPVERDEYTAKVLAAITEFTARLDRESQRFGLQSPERMAA